MARTRSSKPVKSSAIEESTSESPAPSSNAKQLPPSSANPPKAFILPRNASSESRIVTLDNPATGNPSRYFFCPEQGFFEFTRICAPKKSPRSWLITPESEKEQKDEGDSGKVEGMSLGSGYITKNPDLFVATPMDSLFFVLPALAPKSAKQAKQHFLALDDYIDTLSASNKHLRVLLAQRPSLLKRLEKRLSACCDSVEAGDETMYRLSTEKLLSILIKKAQRICNHEFPGSMEDKFIKPSLDIPVMSIRREDSNISIVSSTSQEASSTTIIGMADSQGSTITAATAVESQSTTVESQTTAATTPEESPAPQLTTPPEVPGLLRLRTALTYIFNAYVPRTLHTPLQTLLSSAQSTLALPSFTTLDTHLTALAKLKAEAVALRSISDNISRKRGYEEDEEKAAEREEKKRKKEEEDRRKKSENRSIKQLKKVDTSGMKKLSSFFSKVPAKKA